MIHQARATGRTRGASVYTVFRKGIPNHADHVASLDNSVRTVLAYEVHLPWNVTPLLEVHVVTLHEKNRSPRQQHRYEP